MNRREFLGSAASAAFLRAPAARPNIVVIVSDDQGIGDIGCYGAKDILTPNLDRLAAEGVRFTDWHASSPVCSPSRAALITGKYPQRAGIPEILFSKPDFAVPGLRKGEKTLAAELRAAGYSTAAIGKWHLGSAPGSRPLEQGFDEFFGFYSGWIDYFSHRFYTLGGQPVYHDLWRNEKEVWHEPEYQTELLGREAREFLARQKAGRPFFLYLAFGAPHYPMMAPAKYLQRFPASMDRNRRLHAAMVAALDDAVGGVLGALPPTTPSSSSKATTAPPKKCARTTKGGATAAAPTASTAGTREACSRAARACLPFSAGREKRPPDAFPATSAPAWTSCPPCCARRARPCPRAWMAATSSPPRRGRLFWEYTGQTAVRDGNWKLIDNAREALNEPPGQKPLLFDLASDPGERQDLADRHPERVREFQQAIEQWRARLRS